MDPITVSALTTFITSLVGGAAGEAGKTAWASLTDLVRRRFGRDSPAAQAIERAGEHTPEEIGAILVERAQADPEFGESLAAWGVEATRVVAKYEQKVSNVITGTVHGNAVQIDGDVHGSINIGR
ncbi:MAG TPA: hypothetical protein VIR33_04065 [Thermopolyspora sp.]|jgi:hypothetical protein